MSGKTETRASDIENSLVSENVVVVDELDCQNTVDDLRVNNTSSPKSESDLHEVEEPPDWEEKEEEEEELESLNPNGTEDEDYCFVEDSSEEILLSDDEGNRNQNNGTEEASLNSADNLKESENLSEQSLTKEMTSTESVPVDSTKHEACNELETVVSSENLSVENSQVTDVDIISDTGSSVDKNTSQISDDSDNKDSKRKNAIKFDLESELGIEDMDSVIEDMFVEDKIQESIEKLADVEMHEVIESMCREEEEELASSELELSDTKFSSPVKSSSEKETNDECSAQQKFNFGNNADDETGSALVQNACGSVLRSICSLVELDANRARGPCGSSSDVVCNSKNIEVSDNSNELRKVDNSNCETVSFNNSSLNVKEIEFKRCNYESVKSQSSEKRTELENAPDVKENKENMPCEKSGDKLASSTNSNVNNNNGQLILDSNSLSGENNLNCVSENNAVTGNDNSLNESIEQFCTDSIDSNSPNNEMLEAVSEKDVENRVSSPLKNSSESSRSLKRDISKSNDGGMEQEKSKRVHLDSAFGDSDEQCFISDKSNNVSNSASDSDSKSSPVNDKEEINHTTTENEEKDGGEVKKEIKAENLLNGIKLEKPDYFEDGCGFNSTEKKIIITKKELDNILLTKASDMFYKIYGDKISVFQQSAEYLQSMIEGSQKKAMELKSKVQTLLQEQQKSYQNSGYNPKAFTRTVGVNVRIVQIPVQSEKSNSESTSVTTATTAAVSKPSVTWTGTNDSSHASAQVTTAPSATISLTNVVNSSAATTTQKLPVGDSSNSLASSAKPNVANPQFVDLTVENELAKANKSAGLGTVSSNAKPQVSTTSSVKNVTPAPLISSVPSFVQLLPVGSNSSSPGAIRMVRAASPGSQNIPTGARLACFIPQTSTSTVPRAGNIAIRSTSTTASSQPTLLSSTGQPMQILLQMGPSGRARQIFATTTKLLSQPAAIAPSNQLSGITVTPCGVKKHPAPLPLTPSYPANPLLKAIPPKPSLKMSQSVTGIVLSWNMNLFSTHAEIATYQLYAYQENTTAPISNTLWKKVGDVKALPLPMACTLTHVTEGNKYHFAVRAIDIHSRVGPFSDPTSIMLLSNGKGSITIKDKA